MDDLKEFLEKNALSIGIAACIVVIVIYGIMVKVGKMEQSNSRITGAWQTIPKLTGIKVELVEHRDGTISGHGFWFDDLDGNEDFEVKGEITDGAAEISFYSLSDDTMEIRDFVAAKLLPYGTILSNEIFKSSLYQQEYFKKLEEKRKAEEEAEYDEYY